MDAYMLFDEPFDADLEVALKHWSDRGSLFLPELTGHSRFLEEARVAMAAASRREAGDELTAALIESAHACVVDGVDIRGSGLAALDD
jgi:hypothetical protein